MGLSHFRLQHALLPDLVVQAQAASHDDTPEMIEIIRRFDRLAVRLARILTADPDLQQDLANNARFALTRAVRRHNPAVAGFPAYAKTFMRWAARRTLQQHSSMGTTDVDVVVVDLDNPAFEPFVAAPRVGESIDGWGDCDVAAAVGSLPVAQRDLLEQRYIEDAALKEIAGRSETTVSAVGQRLKTAQRAVARVLAA